MSHWLKGAPEPLLRDLADLFVQAYAGIDMCDPAWHYEAWPALRAIGPAGRYIALRPAHTGPRTPEDLPSCWLKGTD